MKNELVSDSSAKRVSLPAFRNCLLRESTKRTIRQWIIGAYDENQPHLNLGRNKETKQNKQKKQRSNN